MKKLALITGATGDIGKEIAFTLSKNGYDLILCGNKSEFDTRNIQTNVTQLRFDVSNPKAVKKAFEQVKKLGQKLDLVVCSAGIAEKEALLIDKADDEIENIVSVNLNGTIFVNKYALPLMQKGGCIVNIASFLGVYGCSCEATYAATKGGIIALTKSLAKEFSAFNVRVNCISPGYINTKMNAEFSAEEKQNLIQQTPLQRLGEPSDVASGVMFLANNSFITGENIVISGGLII